MCVACRTSAPASELVRFARHPDGVVGVDVRAKLPGRGAWTCPTPSCVGRAVEKGGLARAFEAAVIADPIELSAEVERVIAAEALRGLSIARRVGRLWPGRTEALDVATKRPQSTVIVMAADLARRSQEEVAHAIGSEERLVTGATKDEMGAAIGRRATGVLALATGPHAKTVLSDLQRLARFRGAKPTPASPEGRPQRAGQHHDSGAPGAAKAVNDSKQQETKILSQGVRNLRALRDVAPKRTSAADETPLGPEAHLRRGRDWNERPCKRAVG